MGLSNWNLVTTLVHRIYTNENVCPKSYIGQTFPDDIVNRGRALAARGGDEKASILGAVVFYIRFSFIFALCVIDFENLCLLNDTW